MHLECISIYLKSVEYWHTLQTQTTTLESYAPDMDKTDAGNRQEEDA